MDGNKVRDVLRSTWFAWAMLALIALTVLSQVGFGAR